MRKVIAAINMTLDGFFDHTAVSADEELHQHYRDLLYNSGIILYGRKTYQLMQFWQELIKNPSDDKSMNDFAAAIDSIPKIVFSNTLKDTGWDSAQLSDLPLEQKIMELKGQPGKDISIGSRSLITQLMKSNLIDEYQICLHPVVAGGGTTLFENVNRKEFRLIKTKVFNSGAVTFYYEPVKTPESM